MGLAPDAELIWGIPVARYDSDYHETELFEALWRTYASMGYPDDEGGTWREDLPGELKVHQWGHYDDPDGPRGILTSTRVKAYRADAWKPLEISSFDGLSVPDKACSKSEDQARSIDLPCSFYQDAGWWLVAGYG